MKKVESCARCPSSKNIKKNEKPRTPIFTPNKFTKIRQHTIIDQPFILYIKRSSHQIKMKQSALAGQLTEPKPPSDNVTDESPFSSQSSAYIHVTAKENDSDSEIEDFTPDRDTNNLWTPQKYSGLTGPVTMNAANGSRKGSKSTKKTTKLAAVPDLNNVRFCRVCEDFLPVTEFPRGQRRYTCRVHLWERNGRKAKKTLLMKTRKKLLTRMWMQCYRDWTCRDRARNRPLDSRKVRPSC